MKIIRKLDKKSIKTEKVLKFVALGGLEEIGRNMMFFEYKDEIIIIDAGLQFPEETTPGVDYIIPNISYLEKNKSKIKAILITHAHYDHIGAIPYIIEKLGNPLIYATSLTKEIINKRQAEFPNSPKLNFVSIKGNEKLKISSNFKVQFFSVTHNIPEGVGMIIETPIGKIVHPGEFKFDYDQKGNIVDLDTWEKIGKENIHTLLLDSTGAEEPGYSLSERVVEKELEKIFKKSEGRIIVATFASLLDRIYEIIKIADKLNRKVAISGTTMKNNIQIAKNLGFMKIRKGVIISLEEVQKYKDNKILVICTGAQGEPNASLVKIASGQHKYIKIKKGDTVIFSSSIIPGNERSVQILKDDLARQGAIVYHYKMVDIHSSGHAPQEELKTVMKLVKPKFFIPIHGYYFMRWQNAQLAKEAIGLDDEHIALVDNGQVVLITKDSIKISQETIPSYYVMVDGLGVGDVGEIVLRDRLVLAQEGMIVIIATLDKKTGRFLKNPDIISRGFIYLRENKELVEEIRKKIKFLINRIPRYQQPEPDYIKALIRDQLAEFIYRKTKRRPMILPVLIEV